jgi:hypothetical protein
MGNPTAERAAVPLHLSVHTSPAGPHTGRSWPDQERSRGRARSPNKNTIGDGAPEARDHGMSVEVASPMAVSDGVHFHGLPWVH